MVDIVGLEMPTLWRTVQNQDNTFDISADKLNGTGPGGLANRQMFVPFGTVDWGGPTSPTLHTNAADPVNPQDLATKFYVDSFGGNLWSTFPAIQDVDYVSTYKNINLINPTNPQDSATKDYVDSQFGSIELDDLTDVTINTPLNEQFIRYNSGSGQWENVNFTPGAGPAIQQGNSSVTVIDSGVGRVETVIDSILRSTIDSNTYDIKVPLFMNSQRIQLLGTPSDSQDATTKDYVDTEIANAGIKTDLNSLTDVTITTPLIDQFLVNDGAGQWINTGMTRSLLPSEIAYEDEVNTFANTQNFSEGFNMAADKNANFLGGFLSNIDFSVYDEHVSSDPPDPSLNQSTLYLEDGVDFGSPNPIWAVLIDRDGVIEKKPVVTSETVFALRQFSNGMFTQETGTKVITDGAAGLRVQIFNENQVGQSFEVVLDGNIFLIADPDTSPSVSNSIDLTAGTDTAPTKHWVWIQIDAGVPTMTSSTIEFPQTGDFAVVGTFLFQSQASVLADGSYAVNSPDYEVFDESSRGHLAHLNDRLATQDALYISEIVLTPVPDVGGGTAGNVVFSSTAGQSFELHREDIEAFDITTGIALVENEGTQTSLEVTRVNDIGLDLVGLTCANGTTVIANNDRINVVVYTIHNDDEPNQTNYGINLPFDVYGTNADSIDDVDGFAIKTIPINIRGIAMLIAEIDIAITGGGTTFEVIAFKDLRGQIPGSQGGTGGGGGGVAQLNDLSDVTISVPLIDQILQNDGAGQWVNVANPAGLLAANNIWLGYQDYTAVADPGSSVAGVGRFFVETLDASNDGLFIYLNQDGTMRKVRVA